MSKAKTVSERSPERQSLADAIAAREAAEREVAPFAAARARVEDDLRLAKREVEKAEEAVKAAAKVDREALAEAYAIGGELPGEEESAVAEAEAALANAKRRVANLQDVTATLAKRGMDEGMSVSALNTKVQDAIRDAVRKSPEVERLVNDFIVAKRAFHRTHATLIWLALEKMIPAHLQDLAPKSFEAHVDPPDPAWRVAIEALSKDADANLP
jgi:hypothetical protein